ncbi:MULTISPECIES: hypothetical protein [Halocynthiibacter]|uniref:Uncharacterized protein n=1 Tax=Halocynthiibacter halioticoli TaxID=2986804 RepID=A0AAE3IXE0_9RHOB|nr:MULTISPECIES: hypothetical protein [Halocynthiibacter]MCV6823900.1 hypothetical protein [Halocynthiibacter halioticoli]MCW4056901.1 hypothetical protein [Halocynthiibacter sp. SDUM655004]
MMKVILGIVIGAAVVGGVYYWQTKPEPTPAERIEKALNDAGDAAKEAQEALKDGATMAGKDLQAKMEETAAEFAESIGMTVEQMSAEVTGLVEKWEQEGILTENGFDYNKATDAVNDSTLAQDTKDQIDALLEQIRDTPEVFEQKWKEIGALLKAEN